MKNKNKNRKKKSKKSLSSLYLVIRFQNNSGDARYVSFTFWMFSLQNQEHYRSGSLKNLYLDTNMCYLLPTLAWQGAINGLLAWADKEKIKTTKGQLRCSEWEFKTAISNVNFPCATGTVILTYITETDWACYRCRRSITGTIPLPFWSRSCRFARGTEARNTETTLKLVLILYYSSFVSHNIFFLSPAMPWSMEIASMLFALIM